MQTSRISTYFGTDEKIVGPAELSLITVVAGQRLNPVRHIMVRDFVREALLPLRRKIKDEFHATSHKGNRYIGLFHTDKSYLEMDWVLAMTNANDGSGSMELHSGVAFPDLEYAQTYHETRIVLRKYGFLSTDEIQALVNENVELMQQHFNLEVMRMDHYKQITIAPEKAHHIICRVIQTNIIAGRVAFELIQRWSEPFPYLKPRTLWSLFVLCSWFTNRLRSTEMISRSEELHNFFDDIAHFDRKATKWVQTQFA